MHGSAEFLAPETRMVPVSGRPPVMRNLSMKLLKTPEGQCIRTWGIKEQETARQASTLGNRH
jgi:hypothetical protein